MPIRVLHICEPFNAGSYRLIHDICRAAPEGEFEFAVLYGNRVMKDADAIGRDFPHARLIRWTRAVREMNPRADAAALREVVRAIDAVRPDVVHCHTAKAGTLGRIAALMRGRRARAVYTPNGLAFLQLTESRVKRTAYRWIERAMAALGGTVVSCSESEQSVSTSAGIDSHVIRNGVWFDGAPSGRPASSFAGPPWRIVTVGRIVEQKNPALFDAVARGLAAEPAFEFTWIGDGELRHRLTSSNVTVTGWMPSEDVQALLSSAHVYVSTALWEGLPLAVLEAMTHSLPLVLSDCVGNRDLAHASNGALIRSADDAVAALRRMTATGGLLAQMGAASRSIVESEFRADRTVAEYTRLYRRLAA